MSSTTVAPAAPGSNSSDITTNTINTTSANNSNKIAYVMWAGLMLIASLGLYVFRGTLTEWMDGFGAKFNTFLQPFKVSRAAVFKNYLILLLLYVFQMALNQEIPLMDVPNGVFLILMLITWIFWFVLSFN